MIKTLSKSQIEDLNEKLFARFGTHLLSKKDIVQIKDDMYLLVNGEPHFFMYEKQWVPTLKLIIKNSFLKTITVDMGAIKFVVSGADIMRPGVVDVADEIKANDFIVIIDDVNKKPLAIGVALFNSQEIKDYLKGRVIKNIHFVGDTIWKASL